MHLRRAAGSRWRRRLRSGLRFRGGPVPGRGHTLLGRRVRERLDRPSAEGIVGAALLLAPSVSTRQSVGNRRAHMATTRRVPTPPRTTDGTPPSHCAVTPDSMRRRSASSSVMICPRYSRMRSPSAKAGSRRLRAPGPTSAPSIRPQRLYSQFSNRPRQDLAGWCCSPGRSTPRVLHRSRSRSQLLPPRC
jgi:hypothetical protein